MKWGMLPSIIWRYLACCFDLRHKGISHRDAHWSIFSVVNLYRSISFSEKVKIGENRYKIWENSNSFSRNAQKVVRVCTTISRSFSCPVHIFTFHENILKRVGTHFHLFVSKISNFLLWKLHWVSSRNFFFFFTVETWKPRALRYLFRNLVTRNEKYCTYLLQTVHFRHFRLLSLLRSDDNSQNCIKSIVRSRYINIYFRVGISGTYNLSVRIFSQIF